MDAGRGSGTVVVVDDDETIRALVGTMLEKAGYTVRRAASGDELRRALANAGAVDADAVNAAASDVDAVVLDVMLPRENGHALLAELRRTAPKLPVIMLTASPDAQSAVDALKAGAYDYLLKPVRREDLLLAVRNAVEKSRLERELAARAALDPQLPEGLVAVSTPMRRVVGVVEQIRHSHASVLLTGPSGSGKEVIARHVHSTSGRRGAFVAVNCAALPHDLVESELFGHERGAFTGADKRRLGRFEEAEGGTLFLDEIGEVPLAVQPKLLRALQEREVQRVGGERVAVDVRVVAATNVALEDAVRAGRFRADLLYRLDVVRLRLPPLSERPADIVPLARTLLRRVCQEERVAALTLTRSAEERLVRWSWPGNVRELENVLRRTVLLLDPGAGTVVDAVHVLVDDGVTVDADAVDVGAAPAGFGADVVDVDVPYAVAREAAVGAFEREYVLTLLRATRGNLAEAARRAGVDRSNLRRVMVRNGISPDSFRDET
jgi:two-component system response regulator HydG